MIYHVVKTQPSGTKHAIGPLYRTKYEAERYNAECQARDLNTEIMKGKNMREISEHLTAHNAPFYAKDTPTIRAITMENGMPALAIKKDSPEGRAISAAVAKQAQIDALKTIVEFAEHSRITYEKSKEWTNAAGAACMTIRVPVALLNRIRELPEVFPALARP